MKRISLFAIAFTITVITLNAHAAFSDKVLVIVNEDVITQSEYEYRLKTVLADIEASGREIPQGEIEKQLLDGMVADKLQLQEAEKRGLQIGEEELNGAMQRFSAQQNMTVQQLAVSLAERGEQYDRFREQIRDTLIINRLTEYYARARVIVPDYEISGFIEQNNMQDGGAEYQIAHILLKNPEQNRAVADQIVNELRNGLSFQKAVLTYSEATDAQEGGILGWRKPDQLPEVFLSAIKSVQVGEVTDVLESPNGLHILKLVDQKGQKEEVVQSQVRHILIGASTNVARSQASKKLFELRQEILEGKSFEEIARIYSDDSVSAASGGDLGWVSPGDMVQQFEATFQRTAIGEISQPFSTQFGVHILEVTDRRKKNITDQLIRARADNFLRRQRAEREFQQWVRELREQAYIEFVSSPA